MKTLKWTTLGVIHIIPIVPCMGKTALKSTEPKIVSIMEKYVYKTWVRQAAQKVK